jgi:hypothetical protein
MNLQYISDSTGKTTGVFIPIEDWEKLQSQIFDIKEIEYEGPTKAEIMKGLKDALEEVRLHQQGKIKLKSARELLNEL